MTKPIDFRTRQLREEASLTDGQKRALVWGEAPKRRYPIAIYAAAAFATGVAVGLATLQVLRSNFG